MEFLIMGVITAFDFLILKWKFEHKRYADFTMDLGLMILILKLFDGSMGGMVIGMIAQVIISFYLLMFPPKFLVNMRNSMDVKK
jgi:hypothetical protein